MRSCSVGIMLLLCRIASGAGTRVTLSSSLARKGNVSGHHWTIGQIEDPPNDAPHCGPLSKALLDQFAVKNMVLVTVLDQLIMQKFGRSWVRVMPHAHRPRARMHIL